mmetsp:Transcript_29561/g.62801  ORF Transcript_29561/g.62801 Transcript_29561/m.62801 type:complete len:260 (-) Transcript_29561:55-834(-)
MPVVPPLPNGEEGYIGILRWVGHHIIGMITIQMRRTVYQPSEMQNQHVSKASCHKEGRPEAFAPKLDSHLSWEHVAHVELEPRVKLLLKHDNRIFVQVTEIQLLPCPHNLRVLLDVKPPHVCEKEAAHGIVGISIRLRVFVVNTVITGPVVDRSLVGNGVAEHEEETDREGRGVGAVGPEAVNSDSYAKATNRPQKESPHKSFLTAFHNLREPENSNHMHQSNVDAHRPIDRACIPVMPDQRRDFTHHFERDIHGYRFL